jgi:hypothetical protein
LGNTTLVNGRSPVTKNSNGTVLAAPDVCKTPSPAGPVPIPYPNFSKSADLAQGSSSVTIDGAPVCLKDSNFMVSTGNEAGAAGGVASSKVKGKAEPVMYSFDVKIEGKPVVRNLDLFLANDKNTPPAPIMQAQPAIVMAAAEAPGEQEKCEFCKKPVHDFAENWGTNSGSSAKLDGNIFSALGHERQQHRWFIGGASIAAHHLICSEAVDDDEWAEICRKFGYDINRKENGVILPMKMQLACQAHAPLHRGPHDKGSAGGQSYPRKIKQLVGPLKDRTLSGAYCDNPGDLTADMDAISKTVAQSVDAFAYTLTADGRDYAPGGRGCAGATSVTVKPVQPCPHGRSHGLRQKGSGPFIAKKAGPLKVGE